MQQNTLIKDNMKTAIEWLVSQLNKEGFAQVVTDEEIAQALAMEKQQIKNAYYTGGDDEIDNPYREAEQYYNETFCRQFIADNKTSSATKCICGKEKFEHI